LPYLPSSSLVPLSAKIPLYAEANIKEVWIVNLKEECLEVYRHPLQGSYQAIHKYYRGEIIFIESFPAIELTLIEILGNKSEIKG
jgi:Uma2 family endonuclease